MNFYFLVRIPIRNKPLCHIILSTVETVAREIGRHRPPIQHREATKQRVAPTSWTRRSSARDACRARALAIRRSAIAGVARGREPRPLGLEDLAWSAKTCRVREDPPVGRPAGHRPGEDGRLDPCAC